MPYPVKSAIHFRLESQKTGGGHRIGHVGLAEDSPSDRRTGCAFGVAFDVFTQVIAPHEAFPAVLTGEVALIRVGTPVSTELVGSREPLIAAVAVAHVRFLAGMGAHMRLQVGALVVGLVANVALEIALTNHIRSATWRGPFDGLRQRLWRLLLVRLLQWEIQGPGCRR